MRELTNLFMIDGQPMLTPDGDMELSATDITAADSGRDESGFLHRFVVRQNVKTWAFSYDTLTGEEYAYLERLFAGKETFQFTCPDHTLAGESRTVTAYRDNHEILWRSAATHSFGKYRFAICAC